MSATATPTSSDVQSERLRPYVPRLLIDWLRAAPDERHRAVPGSLAFVDISGFTQMTERLARKGKVGAEEVNDTLDVCFTELLSVAYDYGAGVIKWGGDAVLLLFDGEAHEARACRAALQMQRTLRALGRLRTSAGLITLRMSVGIHSGTFDFFLVGDLHRELVIAGPAATQTVAMEQIAEAGEVVVSAATAAALDPSLLGRPKRDGIPLRGQPAVPVDRPSAPDVAGMDIAKALSAPVRDHLLAGGGEAEHRPITTSFVEVGGTDELYEREGPAALALALDDAVRRVQYACFQHQVAFFETDISFGGVKLLLIAGAPVASGNDAERMLRAMRAFTAVPGALPVRIGVNSGRVFCGDFGPPYRRTYSVKGDAVNLAARLMTKAKPGQILTTDATLGASRVEFAREALEPFLVKGKAQPVQAYVVGPPLGAREKARAAAPLVGRDRELAALLAAVESACAWEGRVFELTGEPGMGKSRLLEEVRDRSDGLLALSVACDEYEATTPYFPFRELLRRLLGAPDEELERQLRERVEEVAPHLTPWLPLLGILGGLELPPTPAVELLDERFRRERLHQVARELLGLVLSTPTLLVFEDVHWADDASRDLLEALAQGIDLRPWLLVLTHRGEESLVDGAQRIALEPLSGAEAAALVEVATEAMPLAPHAVAALADRSGGNPLFLSELVAAARRDDPLADLPDSVEALLAAQIDRLAPPDRRLLRAAAVVGATFSRDLLATALEGAPEAADEGAWRRLAAFVLPGPDDTFRFRHALVRDAAYEGLPYRRRRELHARVGLTIERLAHDPADEAELLSLHFFHAQQFEQAWVYSQVAGDRARRMYAQAEAAALYGRALDAVRHFHGVPREEIAAVGEARGDALERLGLFGESDSAYGDARQHRRGDAVAEAALMLKQGRNAERQGRFRQALRWFTRALRQLEAVEPAAAAAPMRAQLLIAYAVIRQMQGRPTEAIRFAGAAIAEAEPIGERPALAYAYYVRDSALIQLGRTAEAVSLPLALDIYEELGDLLGQGRVHEAMGILAYYEGRWDDAVERYEHARDAFGKLGDPVRRASDTFNVAEIRCDQGRLEEARLLTEEALRVWRAAGWAAQIALATRQLGTIALRDGRLADALLLLEQSREAFLAMGVHGEVADAEGRIAVCMLLRGDGRALEVARQGQARTRRLGDRSVHAPMLHRVVGCALLAAGEPDAARAELEASLRSARDQRAPYQIALTLDALVRTGLLDDPSPEEVEAERDSILAELGVVALPPAPARIESLEVG